MHPVEEDSRFAIQPVYPDRQGLCAEGEEHGKKQPALRREGCFFPCRPTDGATVSVRKSASEELLFVCLGVRKITLFIKGA
jgi:hypothetical protein